MTETVVEIREDRWLSSKMGRAVFKIDTAAYVEEHEHDLAGLSALLARHAGRHADAMFYAKVDTCRVEMVRQLSAAGLYVVDVNVTCGCEANAHLVVPKAGEAQVGEVRPEQHQGVLEIAASCFRYSRFHLDPAIPAAIANRIKHDWVLNYIRKERGDRLFVARIDQKPVGFLAALVSEGAGQRVATIDLIGVSTAFQYRGVGQALVTRFINEYRDACQYLQVGTQVANVPSLRLYQKFGFTIRKTAYVMHRHLASRDR